MAEQVSTDRPLTAVLTAVLVAFVCALAVSYTAVTLRPYYLANLEAERQARLASILDALSEHVGKVTVNDVEPRLVELDTGAYAENLNVATYDADVAAADPNQSRVIQPDLDLARIQRRADHARVYVLRAGGGAVQAVILPVYGSGYQSTLYGFLALSADTQSVLALKFYEQNDTPGIGARIQDPEWEALWPGKSVYDQAGELRLGVARGQVPASSEDAPHVVDGISGATRTSLGVNALIRFWLGDLGFGPYLERVRNGEG